MTHDAMGNPAHIETNIRIASMRQIHCAIEHLQRGDFEAAITLAAAAEGMLPDTDKPYLFKTIKRLAPEPSKDAIQSNGANDCIVWLKHGVGPDGKELESARISEIEMYATVMRAISKFKAVFDDASPQMKQFGNDAYERFSSDT